MSAPPREEPEGEDTIGSLRQRVAALTAENTKLRERVAQLEREAAGG